MEFVISPEQALELEASEKVVSKPTWVLFENESLEDKISAGGNPMVLVRAKALDEEIKQAVVFLNILPQFAPLFRGYSIAMGAKLDPKTKIVEKISLGSNCVGKKFGAYVVQGSYEGTPKNEIKKIVPEADLAKMRAALRSAGSPQPVGATK